MKMILTLVFAVLMTGSQASADLILTAVVDATLSGGTPKVLEFFATDDIPDLSIYGVELVSNAASTAGVVETAFSGSILAGEYYYVGTEAANFTSVLGFAPDLTTNDVNHNGDDDFYIYENGILVDVWSGSDGVDNTGTATDIIDSYAYRISNTGPNSTFTASDWTIAAPNTLDGLDAAGIAAAVPFGTFTAPLTSNVPEPSSIALLGLVGLAGAIRRRK